MAKKKFLTSVTTLAAALITAPHLYAEVPNTISPLTSEVQSINANDKLVLGTMTITDNEGHQSAFVLRNSEYGMMMAGHQSHMSHRSHSSHSSHSSHYSGY